MKRLLILILLSFVTNSIHEVNAGMQKPIKQLGENNDWWNLFLEKP